MIKEEQERLPGEQGQKVTHTHMQVNTNRLGDAAEPTQQLS